jgi:uncharacterized protein (TIGR02118 family)
MARLIALFNTPEDPDAFDRHYLNRHVPIARKMPGLRRYEVNNGAIATPSGLSRFHMVGLLEFDSLEALQHALASPEGQAVGADLANFAQAGVELLVFESKEV